ncbi:hypothetical protein [Nocardia miyunensis]|uniref:hypothetical protein n=1 Tax=Nocardia miyunensis TaxID=282684 RepID=UPI000A92C34A
MARLHQPPPGGNYADGWLAVTSRTNGPTLTHVGSNTMWTAETWLFPAKNLILAVTTNRGDEDAQQAADNISGYLVDTYLA